MRALPHLDVHLHVRSSVVRRRVPVPKIAPSRAGKAREGMGVVCYLIRCKRLQAGKLAVEMDQIVQTPAVLSQDPEKISDEVNQSSEGVGHTYLQTT